MIWPWQQVPKDEPYPGATNSDKGPEPKKADGRDTWQVMKKGNDDEQH